jgi:hypothetical protein
VYFQGNAPELPFAIKYPDSVFGGDNNAILYHQSGTIGWGPTLGNPAAPTALWNPRALTDDGSFGVRQNRFGFNITGTPDIPLVIEASTNLAAQSWAPLQSCTLTNGLIYFSDAQWTTYPNRVYRIRSP